MFLPAAYKKENEIQEEEVDFMKIEQVRAVYFSATGTTEKVVTAAARAAERERQVQDCREILTQEAE